MRVWCGETALSCELSASSLEVLDQGPEFTLENAPAGHGIDILKQRLSALFGAQGALVLERRDDRNYLTLSVPQAHTTQ